MDVSSFKNIIAEWLSEWEPPPLTNRTLTPVHLKKLSDILAVVGPRRSGKTYFMCQLIMELFDNGVAREEILFLDFEDFRLNDMKPSDIENLFTAFYQLTDRNPSFLFFDEVHNMPQWSKVIRTLHNQGRYKIIVSGSNSKLLAKEISTELRGRYRDIMMLPFSFQEILRFKNISWDRKTFHIPSKGGLIRVFDDYLKEGGFPEVIKRDNNTEKRHLLQSYYQTLFYRDILERHNIRAKVVMESLMQYCLDTFGTLFSISSFTNLLKSNDMPISKKTVSNYLQYLRDAFFIIANEKFDFSPRKRLMNPKKIYLLDVGFANLATSFSENRCKFLENIVAIELFRRQEEMFYYKNRYECDFVVKQGLKPNLAIQVCLEMDINNRNRELKGLYEAMKKLKLKHGLILTYQQEGEEKINDLSVKILPVWKWLLNYQ